MARFKSILKGVSLKRAGKKRKCYHDSSHSIQKGDLCLEVTDGIGSPGGYCVACALSMLAEAETQILGLRREIQAASCQQ
jgi:hypothetical protein